MPSHVVAATTEIPPGTRKRVEVAGRGIVVFNLGGEYFALFDRCPHRGGSLYAGRQTGLVEADAPGAYRVTRPGEFIRCPWHAWEFEIRTGKSWCDPQRLKARSYPASVASGAALVEGPYVAGTVPVRLEADYVLVEL